MKMLFIWLCAVCSLFTLPIEAKRKHQHRENKKPYLQELALCAIFRDEARFLKEWIEFHKLVGVTTFYLYNNLSEDDYNAVLEPYIASGEVKLEQWPFSSQSVEGWTLFRQGHINTP